MTELKIIPFSGYDKEEKTMAKEDLRIIKTKEKLSSALMVLLKTESLKEVKISELCAQAKVSRATFYNNFDTVDDVLSYYITKFELPLEEILEKNVANLNLNDKSSLPRLWKAYIFPIVAELEKKKDEIYDVINEQKLSGDFYLAILGFITSTMTRILPLYKSQRDVKTPDEVSIAHAAGGMTNLLFNLLQTGDKYTLEEKQFFVYHLVFEQPNSFFELQDSKGY